VGDRLPYSSKFSANLALDQDFPLTAHTTGFVGAEGSYVGKRIGDFTASTVARQDFPSYVKLDLRAGIRYDTWTANVFVNNVTDKRGIFSGAVGPPVSVQYIQPRTYGLQLGLNLD
jgi:outer membrane receptor protein involved in Fe transport